MPANKNGGNKPASDENRRNDQHRGRNSPAYPYEADKNLEKGYEGYDEDRSSLDPRESDFDTGENDISKRKDQYKNEK